MRGDCRVIQFSVFAKAVLLLLLLFYVTGCAVERGNVYVKDGKQYGVTSRQTWRDRWWDYYDRGMSYAAGEFWDDALADLQAAAAQRDKDQRDARTYGMHLMDYFPHRESGIIYYRRARHRDAIQELKHSLASEATAKAKFYLNKSRKALLLQNQTDAVPPRILLHSPEDGLLTNRFSVTVAGQVEDDTYVAAIAVNGHDQFIDLAEPRLPFAHEVALRDGANTIDIVAGDLVGHQVRRQVTVHLDRQGPLLSLDAVRLMGAPPQQRVRVEGLVADYSRITRFVLGGRPIALQTGREWDFAQEVPFNPGMEFISFEVEDAVGNVTRGEIAIVPLADTAPGNRQGRGDASALTRWATRLPGRTDVQVVSDGTTWQTALLQTARLIDRQQPVIRLSGLRDGEVVYSDTIYLEGRVSDAGAIDAFSINGESLWRRQTRQLFFAYTLPLQAGNNVLTLQAIDAAGNQTELTLSVIRQVRQVRRVGSRLRVVLLPLQKHGESSLLSEIVDDYLFNVFVSQRRFDFVERQRLAAILREHKLSQTNLADPATAARAGKIATAEGIVAGMVTETPTSLEVFARFVDVETGTVLAAEDVYGEDLTPRSMKTLMEGLAWKLRRHFPLLEGFVIENDGKRLTIDLAERQGIKRYMKLIVFRSGKTLKHPQTGRLLRKPDKVLGEARIVAVTQELSEAVLIPSKGLGRIRASDKVITK
ncbi:MAG: hypothetical protein O7G88_00390 [bacterium]|nr:hypothetical protein [bacterium]